MITVRITPTLNVCAAVLRTTLHVKVQATSDVLESVRSICSGTTYVKLSVATIWIVPSSHIYTVLVTAAVDIHVSVLMAYTPSVYGSTARYKHHCSPSQA